MQNSGLKKLAVFIKIGENLAVLKDGYSRINWCYSRNCPQMDPRTESMIWYRPPTMVLYGWIWPAQKECIWWAVQLKIGWKQVTARAFSVVFFARELSKTTVCVITHKCLIQRISHVLVQPQFYLLGLRNYIRLNSERMKWVNMVRSLLGLRKIVKVPGA